MKVYRFTPHDLGFEAGFPPGELRFETYPDEDMRYVGNPDEADAIVVPPSMSHLGLDRMRSLSYKVDGRKVVAFNVTESMRIVGIGYPGLFLRCDCTQEVKRADPTTVSIAWPVEDLGEYGHVHEGFAFDVGFHGWVSTPLCQQAINLLSKANLNCDLRPVKQFYGCLRKREQAERREPFLASLAHSRLSLSVRSIPEGVIRYRFYEALSMGRVPILINDNCVLPFSEHIDYNSFILRVKECDVKHLPDIVGEFLSQHSDDELKAMGAFGRSMWLKYLTPARWERTFYLETRRHLRP